MNSKTPQPCPACCSDQSRFLFEGWDLWFGYPDSASVYQCRDCKHVFVAGVLTPEQLTDMYTNYCTRSSFDVENYVPYKEKNRLLHWLDGEEGLACRHVPKNVRVLDIGCGFCETLGYHRARGCDAYGVEADENTRKIAERYGFNVHLGLFDPAQYEPGFFDYVTMDQVLEHTVDPLTVLREVATVLKSPSQDTSGGRLVACFPNDHALGRLFFQRHWGGWHLPFHRHLFSRQSIAILAERSGYVVESMKSATQSCLLLQTWATIYCAGSRGKKADQAVETFGRFFDSEMRKRRDVSLYLFLKKIRFLSLSMRIADMLGVGDCRLVILRKK